jgi:hypothetical protein
LGRQEAVLVKEAVGHSTLAMTMKCTQLAREHLRALVEPVPEAELSKKLSLGVSAVSN